MRFDPCDENEARMLDAIVRVLFSRCHASACREIFQLMSNGDLTVFPSFLFIHFCVVRDGATVQTECRPM